MTEHVATNLPDHVRVKNLAEDNLVLRYNSQEYVVPAEGDALVPAECAAIWFGDWNKRNTDRKPDRNKEVTRLRGLYGAHAGFEGADTRWEERQPKVELYTADGQRLIGVLDDPSGDTLPAVGGEYNAKLIDDMRTRMQEMEARMQEMTGGLEDIPEDTPDKPPARKKRKPQVEPAREETG